MRIFVTGASGFIGSHFVEHATAAGHKVVGLRRPDSNGSSGANGSAASTSPRAVIREGDLLDRASLDAALAGVDCVCHFAAAFKESGADETYFHRVNVDGTANLMAAAHAAGVKRFVLCSTAGIYGSQVDGVIDETHPTQPWNAYERSKLAAEEEVRRGATEYGMEYVILRPSSVYGPRDARLSKLFKNAARGRFPLFGNGEGRRHMVYVGDLANAFLRACVKREAANQEMIIAGPEAVQLRELLQTLASLASRRSSGPQLPLRPMLGLAAITESVCRFLNVNPPLHRRRMDFYTNDTAFDCTRARAVLGWEPKVTLREGLEATLLAEQGRSMDPRARQAWFLGPELLVVVETHDALGIGFLLV